MRTVQDLLNVLDNLTASWMTLGYPSQHKVQAEAVAELRQRLNSSETSSTATVPEQSAKKRR